MPEEKKPGWVSGRTRESADGLSRRRPASEAEQRKLREATERQQQKERERGGGDGSRNR